MPLCQMPLRPLRESFRNPPRGFLHIRTRLINGLRKGTASAVPPKPAINMGFSPCGSLSFSLKGIYETSFQSPSIRLILIAQRKLHHTR